MTRKQTYGFLPGIVVCKFGGSSITTPADVERIKRIVRDDPDAGWSLSRRLAGDNRDMKVTDLLIQLAGDNNRSLVEQIVERYRTVDHQGAGEEVAALLKRRLAAGLRGEARLDSLKAVGEEACTRTISKATGSEYVDPREILAVSPDHGNARILPR